MPFPAMGVLILLELVFVLSLQRDGKFYAQRFRSTLAVLDNGCRQGAFFHMQEWKKIWGYGTHGVDPLELALTTKKAPSFTVTTEGITLLT